MIAARAADSDGPIAVRSIQLFFNMSLGPFRRRDKGRPAVGRPAPCHVNHSVTAVWTVTVATQGDETRGRDHHLPEVPPGHSSTVSTLWSQQVPSSLYWWCHCVRAYWP